MMLIKLLVKLLKYLELNFKNKKKLPHIQYVFGKKNLNKLNQKY